jgi:hypothetical protein
MTAQLTQAEWLVMEAMYETFVPLLRNKSHVAAQMATEIDAIAQRYAEQYLPNEKRPERYRSEQVKGTPGGSSSRRVHIVDGDVGSPASPSALNQQGREG